MQFDYHEISNHWRRNFEKDLKTTSIYFTILGQTNIARSATGRSSVHLVEQNDRGKTSAQKNIQYEYLL